MAGYEATGIYTAAYKVILMFMMVSRLLCQVLFPTLSTLHITSKDEFKNTVSFSYRAVALGAFPMAFGLFFISDRIVLVLFKKEFLEAVLLLKVMSFSLLFSSLHMVLITALNSSHEERKVAWVIVLVTAFNIALNFMLIPRFGGIGASVSTLLSEIMIYGGIYYYFRKRLFKVNLWNSTIRIVAACIGMSVFILHFNQMILPALVLTSALVYFGLAWIFGVISSEEIRGCVSLFKRKAITSQIPR
jgi:O-antigen/teichoic acid export membrane protein